MDIGTAFGSGAGNYRDGTNYDNSGAFATVTGTLIATDVAITALDVANVSWENIVKSTLFKPNGTPAMLKDTDEMAKRSVGSPLEGTNTVPLNDEHDDHSEQPHRPEHYQS